MKDFFEHIGEYLSNKLSDEDRLAFEQAMKEDPELASAVDNHSIVDESLDILLEDDIRGVINGLQFNSGAEPNNYMGIKTYLILAGIMLLLAALAYFIKQKREPDHQILYAQYYSEYIDLDVRGDSNSNKPLSACEEGHSLMQDAKYDEARSILDSSARQQDECTDKSQWYLSLILLLENNSEGLDSLLNIIKSDRNSPYQGKAVQLFEDIH